MNFETFWQQYPRKVGKGMARKRWEALAKKKILPKIEVITDALAWQKKSEAHLKRDIEFIPHPSTWLNAERWDDEKPTKKSIVKHNTVQIRSEPAIEEPEFTPEQRAERSKKMRAWGNRVFGQGWKEKGEAMRAREEEERNQIIEKNYEAEQREKG